VEFPRKCIFKRRKHKTHFEELIHISPRMPFCHIARSLNPRGEVIFFEIGKKARGGKITKVA